MSNTKKPGGKPYSLDRYRREATGEPFVLWVDDDRSITVPRPTGEVLMAAEEATSSRRVLELLLGDLAGEFFTAVGAEDFTVMQAVSRDMQEHFGLGE